MVNSVRVPASIATFLVPAMGIVLGFNLPGIIAALLAATFFSLVAYLLLCFRAFPSLRQPASVHFRLVAPLVAYGGWVTVSSVVGPILVYLDRFLLGSLLTMTAVAYYSGPYEIITRLWILPSSLVLTLFPVFSALGIAEDRVRLQYLFTQSVKWLLLVMGPIVVVLILFAETILGVWLGSDFAKHSTLPFQWLAVGVLLNSLAYLPHALLQGLGRPDITAKLHLIELPLYGGVAWVLVAHLGITGAALAWTLRSAIDGLLLTRAACKLCGFSPRVLIGSSFPKCGGLFALAATVAFA